MSMEPYFPDEGGPKPAWLIEPDSEYGREIGFTSDKFDGYLARVPEGITVSFIVSRQPGRGHLRALFAAIRAKDNVFVPTPSVRMSEICARLGGERRTVEAEFDGFVEAADGWFLPREAAA